VYNNVVSNVLKSKQNHSEYNTKKEELLGGLPDATKDNLWAALQ